MIEVSLLFNPVYQQKKSVLNSRTDCICGATLFDPFFREPSLQSANTLLSRNAGTASQILALRLALAYTGTFLYRDCCRPAFPSPSGAHYSNPASARLPPPRVRCETVN